MEKVRLAELVTLVRGVSYKKEQASKNVKEGYTSILRANNINDGAFNFDELVFVPSDLVTSQQKISKNDIVITMSSGSKAHVGKVAIAKTDMDSAFGAFCAKIIPQRIVPKYLFYILRSSDFRHHIETSCKGTNINNIKQEYILNYELLLPSIPEQERIVARIEELFSQLDSGVETLKKTKEQLAVYRQAVLSDLYPAMTKENTVRLDNIAQITGGITKGRDLACYDTIELPYLRVANVQDGFLDLSEMKTIELKTDEKEKYLLAAGDVLYTEGGDRDKLGRGTVWNDEIPNCVHQNHVFKARIDKGRALPQYVAYWSMSRYARNYFYSHARQSVNLASINKSILSALLLPLPDIAVQADIVDIIDTKMSICADIEKTIDVAIQQAEAMRQSILKKAFEGEI